MAGYSFGACVAFEMTKQLESENKSPLSLSLLDGSHSYVASIIHGYKSKLSSSSKTAETNEVVMGEVEALTLFTLQLYPSDVGQLRANLLAQESWSARLIYVSNTIYEALKQKMSKSPFTVDEVSRILKLII